MLNVRELFRSKYGFANLKVDKKEFKKNLKKYSAPGSEWMTAYAKFTDTTAWGHEHDFGEGVVIKGSMGDRHFWILEEFIKNGLPENLTGKEVLVIGCYTGGDALALAAMGAKVMAIEEVPMYARIAKWLAEAFKANLQVTCLSTEDFDLSRVDQKPAFDFVYSSGVLYHLKNPMLGLYTWWSSLTKEGQLFMESMLTLHKDQDEILQYTGDAEPGYNYFVPNMAAAKAMLYDSKFNVRNSWVSHNTRGLFICDRADDIVRVR